MELIILLLFSTQSLKAEPTIVIKNCYDGDTCTSTKGEKIRLACINTPELKGKNSEPIAAKSARDFLNELIKQEQVKIRRLTKDRYGRTIAEIYKNNVNIQQLMVNKGYAKVYEKYAYQCKWSTKD